MGTWKYLSRPLVIIDLFVVILPLLLVRLPQVAYILPRWLTSKVGLQNLRLLRILRLQRPLQNQKSFSRYLQALGLPPYNVRPYQLQLARVIFSLFTLLSVSSGLIFAAEHMVNPQITNYF